MRSNPLLRDIGIFDDGVRHRKVLHEYIPDPTALRKKRSRKKNEKEPNGVPVHDINGQPSKQKLESKRRSGPGEQLKRTVCQ